MTNNFTAESAIVSLAEEGLKRFSYNGYFTSIRINDSQLDSSWDEVIIHLHNNYLEHKNRYK